jgi:hypothetical protein
MIKHRHSKHCHKGLREFEMKLWKVAAIIVLVTIPLILVGKKRTQEKGLQPESGDLNDIFERELNVD